jgi:hypothetical protein
MLVAPGDIHTNVPQRFWGLTAAAGNNPLAPNRWLAMLQCAQSTSLIMPSVFPVKKNKDDSSYRVCVGGWVRRLLRNTGLEIKAMCCDVLLLTITPSGEVMVKSG